MLPHDEQRAKAILSMVIHGTQWKIAGRHMRIANNFPIYRKPPADADGSEIPIPLYRHLGKLASRRGRALYAAAAGLQFNPGASRSDENFIGAQQWASDLLTLWMNDNLERSCHQPCAARLPVNRGNSGNGRCPLGCMSGKGNSAALSCGRFPGTMAKRITDHQVLQSSRRKRPR